MATRDGSEFAVADVDTNRALGDAQVVPYATAIRSGGNKNGAVLGVLGIFFDWQPQAQDVVTGVRLSSNEKAQTRCLLVDQNHRVIAASDGVGLLAESLPLQTQQGKSASYVDEQGNLIGYALTPGYETYRGLGWYGVIVQSPAGA